MSEAIQAWINQASAHPAVAGCGVRVAGAVHARSGGPQLTEAQITQAMKELSEAVYFLQQNQYVAERLRWTFEGGQLCCACGRGGNLAMLVLNAKDTSGPEIERLLASAPAA
jgi:hypothetical protein